MLIIYYVFFVFGLIRFIYVHLSNYRSGTRQDQFDRVYFLGGLLGQALAVGPYPRLERCRAPSIRTLTWTLGPYPSSRRARAQSWGREAPKARHWPWGDQRRSGFHSLSIYID